MRADTRTDLFEIYSPILKPSFDYDSYVDFMPIKLDMVADKVLDVSQTGEFISIKGNKLTNFIHSTWLFCMFSQISTHYLKIKIVHGVTNNN